MTDDAYTDRVLLYREGPDLELQIMALDLKDILEGRAKDVTLKRNDVLVISSIHELEERGALSIGGQVARPGSYPFAANTTLEDLIFQAGGLRRRVHSPRRYLTKNRRPHFDTADPADFGNLYRINRKRSGSEQRQRIQTYAL